MSEIAWHRSRIKWREVLQFPQCFVFWEMDNRSAHVLWLHHSRRETCLVQASTNIHKRNVMAFGVRNIPPCNICCME